MGTRHADRLWIFGGVAVVLVLAVISWLFVISPKYAEADTVRTEAADTELKISQLRKRIAELEKDRARLPEFKRTLERNRHALPADSGVPDFLRQLQSSGDALDVSVGGVNVSAPQLVNGFTTVYALPMTLTAEGSAENLGSFLRQLQETQPRAVLIDSANMTSQTAADAADGSGTGEMTVSLSLKAFVAVPAGAGAPTITTTK
jgi:type IV pilus assembly protein PilO